MVLVKNNEMKYGMNIHRQLHLAVFQVVTVLVAMASEKNIFGA